MQIHNSALQKLSEELANNKELYDNLHIRIAEITLGVLEEYARRLDLGQLIDDKYLQTILLCSDIAKRLLEEVKKNRK